MTPLPPKALRLRAGRELLFGARPLLAGVLNCTPDSFSDGGADKSVEDSVRRGVALFSDGAALVDIGGESTRPGSSEVSVDEEIRRVVPVVAKLRAELPACALSVDTRKSEVARAALEAGADLINDVSGLHFDQAMAKVAAEFDAALCVMHMRGAPATMQAPENLRYDDLLGEIMKFLSEAAAKAEACGVARSSLVIDPGLGFSKSLSQNVELLAKAERFHELGLPLFFGPSRKRFIGELSGEPLAANRDFGTCGALARLALKGVQIVRVHNVKAARQFLDVFCA